MRVVLYADGSKVVGLGHLARMWTLAQALEGRVQLLTSTPYEVNTVFAGTGVEVYVVDGGDMATALPRMATSADLLVLDPPYFPDSPDRSAGPAWQPIINQVRSSGTPVVRFTDEEQPSAHACDLLVNGYPAAAEFASAYAEHGASWTLLGPRYFLLDSAHTDAPAREGGLFVCFGGSDQSNLLQRFSSVIAAFSRIHPTEIVAGLADLPSAERFGEARVHAFLSAIEFAQRLKGARLALTASGNVLYERLFHGTPGISVAQFPRQDCYGRAFDRLGVTRHLGLGVELPSEMLAEALADCYENETIRQAQRDAAKCIGIKRGLGEIVAALTALARSASVYRSAFSEGAT